MYGTKKTFIYARETLLVPRTMGQRMLAGRDLTWADIYNGGDVAIVSENTARETFYNRSRVRPSPCYQSLHLELPTPYLICSTSISLPALS
jgi:hypothetical protein